LSKKSADFYAKQTEPEYDPENLSAGIYSKANLLELLGEVVERSDLIRTSSLS
jgi:hypothetical protein